MLTVTQPFTAGQTIQFIDLGNFVRVLQATNGVTVRAYRNGAVVTEATGVTGGYAEEYDQPFDKVEVYSATAQTVQVAIRIGGKIYFDQPPQGNVNVVNTSGAYTDTQASVTNADNTIVAANTARRYLLIQNNSTSGVLRVRLDGNAASATSGKRIQPGGYLEIQGYVPTGAIHAFMETADATANNVEISQG